jgi:titin
MSLLVWLTSPRFPLLSSSWRRRQVRRPLSRPHLEALEGRWLPSTFLVTTTDDAGAGSLRQAILDANATPGSNEIHFAIGDGAQTIRPTTVLPEVTHSVVIDGTTQPGFAGSPLIDLDGTNVTPGSSGLVIHADGSTIKGLAITDFLIHDDDNPDRSTPGLVITGSGNVVQGNYLGADLTGARSLGNAIGLWVTGSNNLIGGTTDGAGNLLSGNWYGLYLSSGSANVIQGNYVGTNVTGTAPVGNVVGLSINGSNNTIGGTTAAARNLVSGNGYTGIGIGGNSNQVLGNYIGTDVSGTRALGNYFGLGVSGPNLIGGTDPADGNLISGNAGTGLTASSGARVQGNTIGTDVTGTQPLGNRIGVSLGGSSMASTLLGGTEAGAGNLISANSVYGIIVSTTLNNVVQGNFIGTDVTGTQALGNGSHGVYLETSFGSQIGGTEPGAGNLISGNGGSGVFLGSSGFGNLVQGNLIGTDISGSQPLGNARDGVHADNMNDARGNTIGGEAPGAGNTIAFNGNDGVVVDRSTNIAILGNAIFANGHLGIELLRGGNHDQAAPVLTSATSDGSSITITGALDSTPNTTFTLEFFANRSSDPSGVYEGEQLIGSVLVTTDAAGHASFTVTFTVAIDPGLFLTGTATDSANNTSPFSDAIQVTG